MMDAYNLAVCFGPSVIDIPPRADAVACQANINSVIKVSEVIRLPVLYSRNAPFPVDRATLIN